MNLSNFGEKFTARSGIVSLMEDLGDVAASRPGVLAMGGGNPARIPEASDFLRKRLISLLDDNDRFHDMVGTYQSPQGDPQIRQRLAGWFARKFGWQITGSNIAVTNGGQSAFFMIANMLAGNSGTGNRHLLFPLVPEYIGYSDTGLSDSFFRAARPVIDKQENRFFKYRVDFNNLEIDEQVAGLCVSRPTNPTGNVHTDEEIRHLDALAAKYGIPLIIDSAYGLPFPDIVFTEASPFWSENTLLMLSLSKLGLPGLRSGVLVGSEKLISRFAAVNGILNLASGNIGSWLLADLLDTGDMEKIAEEWIKPFYRTRMQQAVELFKQGFDENVPYYIHQPEGALFLWLWLENLPVDTRELYERLKQKGVLIIPGNDCFPGLQDDWQHTRECVRISYAVNEATLQKGVALITDEVNKLYQTVRDGREDR